MRHLVGFVFLLLALGTLRTVGCGDDPCGDCGDGNPCTIDRCSSRRVGAPPGMCEPDERPVEPYCAHPAEPDGTPCGDGSGVSGVCIDGFCDLCERAFCEPDDNSCTTDCNPGTGTCDYIPLRDGTSCNYDGLSGVCINAECGQDPCEVVSCDDNDACTDDSCWLGVCDHRPVVCDDGNACTQDTCEPPEGCTPVDDGTPCGNGAGTCQGGRCVGLTDACLATDDQVFVCDNDIEDTLVRCTICDRLGLGCPDDCDGNPIAPNTPTADCANAVMGASCTPGLTADCLDCFLEATACGTTMCALACSDLSPGSPDGPNGCGCLDCVAASCDPGFEACAGYSQGIADSGTEGDPAGDGTSGGPPSCEGPSYCEGGRP